MEKENRSINLLSSKGKNTTDVFLFWALYVGRLLIIITEAVALFVFLSRFSIDRKLIDHSDNIKKQQALVEFFKDGEEKYRATQLKLSISKSSASSSSASIQLFDELMQQANTQINFNALSVTSSSMTVTATSSVADVLANFVTQLKNHPRVVSLNVDKVESKPKNAVISITLTAQLKTKEK
jgi:hypothetical protein